MYTAKRGKPEEWPDFDSSTDVFISFRGSLGSPDWQKEAAVMNRTTRTDAAATK
jgi:hypothetical protein